MASRAPADKAAGWNRYRRFGELIHVSMGGYVAYSLFYALYLQQWLIAGALAVPAVVLGGLLALLRSSWPPVVVRLLGHGLLLINMSMLSLSLVWGGLPPSSTVWWLVWWPMFVTHLMGVIDGLVWILIAAGCMGLIWWNQQHGVVAPLMDGQASPVYLMQLGFLLVGAGVSVVVRRAYDRYDSEIQAQQSLIAQQNQVLAQRAEKLEAMLQAVQQASLDRTRLFAQISHEVRTPLNGLLGFAQLMGRTELTEQQALYLAQMNACGQTLLQIVTDVMDFSRLEAQSAQLDSQHFDAVKLAHEAADMVSPMAMQKGVKLIRDLPGTEIDAMGDPLRIRQVLLNLLANAVKFTPGGQVAVRCRMQPAPDGQPALYMEVQDSGIGISADAMQHLFQPFSKASDSTIRQYGGSGLGLAVCKRLVDMMNGRIGVHSQPGSGSLFWFEVPISAQ
jgi:signal transduction histidine kinase